MTGSYSLASPRLRFSLTTPTFLLGTFHYHLGEPIYHGLQKYHCLITSRKHALHKKTNRHLRQPTGT